MTKAVKLYVQYQRKMQRTCEKFKQICAERGTTPYKIAQNSTVFLYGQLFRAGKTVPRVDTLMILCNQLGISVSDIFGERKMSRST